MTRVRAAFISVYLVSGLGVCAERPGREGTAQESEHQEAGEVRLVRLSDSNIEPPTGIEQPLEAEIISLSEAACGEINRPWRAIVFSQRRVGIPIMSESKLARALRNTEPGEYREGLSAITRSVVAASERSAGKRITTAESDETSKSSSGLGKGHR